ncbi:MAG: hypothetical protein L0Y71_24570 [Gemmataceae bacterium]|nr:hypothetical protein [Gemmataceae bacterium]
MEPIQIQCGSCGQMMGIHPDHLGAQVQCPHCQAIVQTPAPVQPAASRPPAPPPSAPDLGSLQVGEHDSIFSQPEPSDDLFGAAEVPKIQMPPLDLPPPRPQVAPLTEPSPTAAFEPAPAPAPAMTEAAPEGLNDDLSTFVAPRRIADRSLFMPVLLIFLVPYAIFTTAFIGYLLYTWPRDNPLRTLPDTSKQGQPRLQVKHDYDLDKDMKTALGRPIRVGAIEVTPLTVKHTADNDLVLVFRARNVSSNLVFSPIADDFLKFSRKSLDAGKPYTFLERVSKTKLPRIYGGTLVQLKGAPGAERPLDPEVGIGPGEEAVIQLTSEPEYAQREVGNFVKAREPLVWRVQVRRGMVQVDGKDVPATTVIGVEFTARDIVRDKREG